MTGNAGIDFLVTIGIVCIIVVTVIQVLNYFGITIPRVVYIIGGAIVGIILLVWLGKMLPILLP